MFAAPRRRKKRRPREEMPEKNQPGPEKANRRQDPQPMATKPVHAREYIRKMRFWIRDLIDDEWRIQFVFQPNPSNFLALDLRT